MEFVKIFILFTSIIFMGNTFSQIPKYCEFYNDLYEEKIDNSYGKYSVCNDGQKHTYEFRELTNLIKDTAPDIMELASDDLKKIMATIATKKVLDKRDSYQGLYPGMNSSLSEDLISCSKEQKGKMRGIVLGNSVSKKTPYDKAKQDHYLNQYFFSAIRAAYLFDLNKSYHSEYRQAHGDYTKERRACGQEEKQCRGEAGWFKSTYHCSEDLEFCREYADTVKQNTRKALDEKIAPLYEMVEGSPFLFRNKVEGSVLSGFSSDKLAPSDFTKAVGKLIPRDFLKDYKKAMEDPENMDIEEIMSKHQKTLNSILNNSTNNKMLRELMEKEAEKEMDDLDKAAVELCENEGDKLHHYPDLVGLAMEEYQNQAKSADELKERVAFSQMAYCHLLREDPPEEPGIDNYTIGGLTLLGVGGALLLIPGVGTISGAALIASGMMTTGGLALTAISAKDTYDAVVKVDQEIALHRVGITEYQNLLKTKEGRDDLLTANLVGGLFGATNAGVIYKAGKEKLSNSIDMYKARREKYKNTSRRLNIERRQQLDRLDEWLGSRKSVFLEKYAPDKVDDLTPGDQIYLAGMVDMAERELKSKNSKIPDEQLAKEVKLVVDDVVKKCGPFRKK